MQPWGLTGQQALAVIEADFQALPLAGLADAALAAAVAAGAGHADVRVSRQRSRELTIRDARAQSSSTAQVTGIGVRVLVDGVWGFAAGDVLSLDSAAALARSAVALARIATPLATERVELAPEPVVSDGAWASPFEVDPFQVADDEVQSVLCDRGARLLRAGHIHHADGQMSASRDLTFYSDTAGTTTINQRTRIDSAHTGWHIGEDDFEDLSTMAAPTARGWEYVADDRVHDWTTAIDRVAADLAEKIVAPSIEPGRYDLLIDPTNLWLTIHESIGHATELDRALGYEANYAGTSFATLDQLGSLCYGSPLMNVTGDRVAPFGLSTTGYDDEGVAAQRWDIVRAGILTGYQLDRRMAAEHGFGRSNGCAFADSAQHVPIQRMPNVSVQPDPAGPDREQLISEAEDAILILGDKSWSIDMARYNFQFTGQLFLRVKGGRVVGQVRDLAYQSRTPDFWGSLARVGGPSTYHLGGALNCGKGQPGQTAAVSHGAPLCLFRGINVLNTQQEAGR